jgi:hypothetical protein
VGSTWTLRGDQESNLLSIGPNWQWVVLKNNKIKRKTGTGTTYSSANDVAGDVKYMDIGADGSVYILNQTIDAGGH